MQYQQCTYSTQITSNKNVQSVKYENNKYPFIFLFQYADPTTYLEDRKSLDAKSMFAKVCEQVRGLN